MKTLNEQIQNLLQQIYEQKMNSVNSKNPIEDTKHQPYIYITKKNNSLNPPCRKIGYSGKDTENGAEHIETKLKRYSTPVPQNWEHFALILLNPKAVNIKNYENSFMEILKHKRYKNKELFKDASDDDIIDAICKFAQNHNDDLNGQLIDVCRIYDENYSMSDILQWNNDQNKKNDKKITQESSGTQIYYWAHMLDDAFVK